MKSNQVDTQETFDARCDRLQSVSVESRNTLDIFQSSKNITDKENKETEPRRRFCQDLTNAAETRLQQRWKKISFVQFNIAGLFM